MSWNAGTPSTTLAPSASPSTHPDTRLALPTDATNFADSLPKDADPATVTSFVQVTATEELPPSSTSTLAASSTRDPGTTTADSAESTVTSGTAREAADRLSGLEPYNLTSGELGEAPKNETLPSPGTYADFYLNKTRAWVAAEEDFPLPSPLNASTSLEEDGGEKEEGEDEEEDVEADGDGLEFRMYDLATLLVRWPEVPSASDGASLTGFELALRGPEPRYGRSIKVLDPLARSYTVHHLTPLTAYRVYLRLLWDNKSVFWLSGNFTMR